MLFVVVPKIKSRSFRQIVKLISLRLLKDYKKTMEITIYVRDFKGIRWYCTKK